MKSIKTRVYELIKKYHTNDPFDIASQKKIIILYEPLGSILGYYQSYKRIQFIHINNQLPEYKQRFVCAHELGHAIQHPKANTPFMTKNTLFSVDKIEREANTFAVELLMPDNECHEMVKQGFTVNEIAATYGVPSEVAHLKKLTNYFFNRIIKH